MSTEHPTSLTLLYTFLHTDMCVSKHMCACVCMCIYVYDWQVCICTLASGILLYSSIPQSWFPLSWGFRLPALVRNEKFALPSNPQNHKVCSGWGPAGCILAAFQVMLLDAKVWEPLLRNLERPFCMWEPQTLITKARTFFHKRSWSQPSAAIQLESKP